MGGKYEETIENTVYDEKTSGKYGFCVKIGKLRKWSNGERDHEPMDFWGMILDKPRSIRPCSRSNVVCGKGKRQQ